MEKTAEEMLTVKHIEFKRMIGVVIAKKNRGFAFVKSNGQTFFLRAVNLKGCDFSKLEPEQLVEFTPGAAGRVGGLLQAVNAKVIDRNNTNLTGKRDPE